MSQIEANGVKTLTIDERKRLKVWSDVGWCSACARGLHWGKEGRVVHIGREHAYVGLCTTCLRKMTRALESAEHKGDPE
jgi:hypothetical protein